MSWRAFRWFTAAGAALAAVVLGLALLVIWDQDRTKNRRHR